MPPTQQSSNMAQLILRIGIAGEFIGHGLLAIQGKQAWIGWIMQTTGATSSGAAQVLMVIGLLDVFIALIVLIRPVPAALLWAAFWGFFTALIRPFVGEAFLDFIERFANWAAPLALLMLIGWPKSWKKWFA